VAPLKDENRGSGSLAPAVRRLIVAFLGHLRRKEP
jgi:hypothetical protein